MAEAAKNMRVFYSIVCDEVELNVLIDALMEEENRIDPRIREELVDTLIRVKAKD